MILARTPSIWLNWNVEARQNLCYIPDHDENLQGFCIIMMLVVDFSYVTIALR